MAELVYALCALTSVACAVLLLRGYAHSGTRLLLWSALCFIGLGVNDALLLDTTLSGRPWPLRGVAGFAGVVCLLYGLIMDGE